MILQSLGLSGPPTLTETTPPSLIVRWASAPGDICLNIKPFTLLDVTLEAGSDLTQYRVRANW